MHKQVIIEELQQAYEHLSVMQRGYAISIDSLDDYHATLDRIRVLRGKLQE